MQMPEENIEIVRRVYESLTRGDDAWRELAAPELVVDFSRRRIDPFVAHGSNDPVLSTLGKVIEFAYFGEDRAAAVEAAGLPR